MPLARRAFLPLLSVVIAAGVVAGPVLAKRLTAEPSVAATAVPIPTRAPAVPPLTRVAPEEVPRKLGGVPPTSTTSTTTPPPPAPSCDDYRDRAAAQAALGSDPDLAERLDTDRDGQACERRWPPTAPPPPRVAPPKEDAPSGGPRAPPSDSVCPSKLAGTRPHVARAGHHLAQRFGVPLASIGGRAGRAGVSDHPAGLALDFPADRATGDDLAAYALTRRAELGITYVIWRQRIDTGTGWEPMEDRGGVTANHFDHVHISFSPSGGAGLPC